MSVYWDLDSKYFPYCWVIRQVSATLENFWVGSLIKADNNFVFWTNMQYTHTHTLCVRAFLHTFRSVVEPVSVVLLCLIASWLEHSAGHCWLCLQQTKHGRLYFSTDFNERAGTRSLKRQQISLLPGTTLLPQCSTKDVQERKARKNQTLWWHEAYSLAFSPRLCLPHIHSPVL